jgi:TPR repeat protein
LDLSPDQAKKAIGALNTALSEGATNVMSACMIESRHALAFKIGNDAYAILICYKCGQLEVYKNDQQLPFHGIIGGNPDALNRLLKSATIPLADDNIALQKSYEEEAQVALKLAEEGDTKAQAVISDMFMRGRGVKKDEAKGADWLCKSMKSSPDDPKFQVALGKMYANDTDQYVTHDYSKALELFQRAAAHGNAEAQYHIGFLYDFGDGVAKSPEEATKWYRQAAENGYAKAQFELGARYAGGTDAKKDYAEALRWFRKAADQAYPEALAWMGTMYNKGWGVPKNKMEAYFWDQLAERYHTHYGNRGITFKPSPKQSVVLEKRLADWVATHPELPEDAR